MQLSCFFVGKIESFLWESEHLISHTDASHLSALDSLPIGLLHPFFLHPNHDEGLYYFFSVWSQCFKQYVYITIHKESLLSGNNYIISCTRTSEEAVGGGCKKKRHYARRRGGSGGEESRNHLLKHLLWWMTGVKVNFTVICVFRHPAGLGIPRPRLISIVIHFPCIILPFVIIQVVSWGGSS